MANTTPPNPPGAPLKQPGFAFPFRRKGQGNAGSSADFTDEHDFHKVLRQEPSGCYSVSGKGMWHGGIHVTEAGAGRSLDLKNGVRCIAEGEVVAWRVNRAYPVSEIPAENGKPAISAPYSTGFALVRHSMEFPRGTTLTFFSLYMHLQDLAGYESDTSQPKPAYWSTQFKVTGFAWDKPHAGPNGQVAPAEQQGLRIRATRPHGTILGILPQGAQVSLSKREGDWGQLKDTHGAQLFAPTAGAYVNPDAAINGWIFLGKENGGPVVEEIMPDSSLDRVVVPSTPVPIKAGELIGHLGRYDSLSQQTASRMVHIEVFCDDSIKSFMEQGRTWISNNGAHPDRWQQLGLPSAPTILRVDRNTTLYGRAERQGQDAKQTGVILVTALAELAKHHEPHVEREPGPDGYKRHWWHVDSADVQGKAIDGWVREESFAGGRVTREFAQKWVGFQILWDAHDPTHTMFATTKAFVDHASGADVPEPAALGKLSPLMASIYRALYPTGDGSRAAGDLCAAAEDPWTALRMSRLIIRHESEWANPDKWKQLIAEIEKQTGPQVQHEAEQRRIEKLVWWDDVKPHVTDLPGSDVFHIHPIGLVGNFCKGKFQFTLAMMQRLFPHADRDVLQEVADELNAHLEAYKLDTPLRRTHFFAQVMQETGPSLSREEGFVWKASSLISSFSYFHHHPDQANGHGYHQIKGIKADGTHMSQADFEAIANGAYGGRTELGNGDYASGDGWRYRGRGLKQLTGRANYRTFSRWHATLQNEWPGEVLDFEENPDLLVQPKYAVRSAAYFWVAHNLPAKADKGASAQQVNAITAIVNLNADSYAARVSNFNTIYSRGDFN
ncbi:glycoside hydrolase family 19 protein [Paraburkholderia lacunae]|uniref:Chitinase n=1 Tax=Paraburkholderia lacunae TaxID=2211104 RepID=A0A370N8B3_9BURK|nr:chitinase [Paraburkholderia lacunae]RDK01853.1 chitinase [Paraburkholderia lacunae]